MTVQSWDKHTAVASLILPLLTGLGTVQAKIVAPPFGSVIEVDTATTKPMSASSRRPSVLPFGTATSAVLRFEWERP